MKNHMVTIKPPGRSSASYVFGYTNAEHDRLMRQPPPPIPPTIGQLIRLLLPLQALFCVASRTITGAVAAALLLILWPISRSVSRRFYAS